MNGICLLCPKCNCFVESSAHNWHRVTVTDSRLWAMEHTGPKSEITHACGTEMEPVGCEVCDEPAVTWREQKEGVAAFCGSH